MPDEIDRATENAAFLLEARIKEQRNNAPQPPLNLRGGVIRCVDCGDVIPEKRRQAMPGCERCVGCQKDFEGRGV